MDPVDVFHLPDGTRFAVDPDLDVYLARLKADFPHQVAALDGFFAEVRECYLLGQLCYFRGRDDERLGRFREMTVRQALDRWFDDRRLKLLLTADCPHWGSPPSRTSFVFDSMLRLSYFLGNYYPRGGSQAFVDDLALAFEESGGHLLMSTAARRIVVEGGAARGVEIETLRGAVHFAGVVHAGSVVSNADLLQTLEELVGPDHLAPELLPAISRLRPTFPCWLTHLGLTDVSADELAEAQGYYWDGWDPDRVGIDALRFKLFVPTLYEPELAPPGGQMLIVQKVQELDFAGITDWERHKHEVERFIFSQLERVLPGIAQRIVVASSATAHTSWRFTRNYRGAMLGWEMSPEQLGELRPALEGVLPGLVLVGHWTRPGGGIIPVIVSAQQAAQRVLEGTAVDALAATAAAADDRAKDGGDDPAAFGLAPGAKRRVF